MTCQIRRMARKREIASVGGAVAEGDEIRPAFDGEAVVADEARRIDAGIPDQDVVAEAAVEGVAAAAPVEGYWRARCR